METRKLQQVGGGTYTVSIPKEWAEAHGLEAGVDVHVYPHEDGSVVVRAAERDGGHLDEASVGFDGDADAFARTVAALHGAGFESVTVEAAEGFDDVDRRAVRSAVRNLVGAEVVAEGEGTVRVGSLLDASTVSVRQSVLQAKFAALSIHRRATEAFRGAEAGVSDRLVERDDEPDRLFAMVARHFNRSLASFAELDRLGTTRAELFDYYLAARQLERVADHGVRIAELGERLDDPPAEAFATEFEESAGAAREVVDDAVTALLDGPDADRARAALDRRDETLADLRALDRAICGAADGDEVEGAVQEPAVDARIQDPVPVARALDGLARTAEYGGNVAEAAIRAAMRENGR